MLLIMVDAAQTDAKGIMRFLSRARVCGRAEMGKLDAPRRATGNAAAV